MKGGDNLLNKEDLGILIEKKRTEKKLTQKELALKIGVVNTAIYKYEKGLIKNIPLENRIKLANSLGIDPDELQFQANILLTQLIQIYLQDAESMGYGDALTTDDEIDPEIIRLVGEE